LIRTGNIFKNFSFFIEKKLYFSAERGILLTNGPKMRKVIGRIHIQNVKNFLAIRRVHRKRDVSRHMEIFVNKTDMRFSESKIIIRKGRPIFFIKS